MKGWVYIITNEAMPGLIKIGYTDRDPEIRAKELNGTGNPFKYKVLYAALVENPKECEQKIHTLLKENRVDKEWFSSNPYEAIFNIRYEIEILYNYYSEEYLTTVTIAALKKQENGYNSLTNEEKFIVDNIEIISDTVVYRFKMEQKIIRCSTCDSAIVAPKKLDGRQYDPFMVICPQCGEYNFYTF
ncbi:GIY-YIG nuclease family protein [uncultured Bilophila sp.]|uniref:GIY-YIG nuclease family protein n=1 Tax=uncultured Bilophila sp. TaxID=529385 RepID=UPI00280B89FE|nr:GIY-YIG nuclease family protein [uncultured Bilophila sp.]